MSTPNLEKVGRIRSFVLALLRNLDKLPDGQKFERVEIAIALGWMAREYRDHTSVSEVNVAAKNDVC